MPMDKDVKNQELHSQETDVHPNVIKAKLLYHGGDRSLPIENIQFPGLRVNCDFGRGFYLAENKETAEEWIRKSKTPIVNVYEYNNDIISIPAFMLGGIAGIGDVRLIKSLEYCKLGNQYVFKNDANGLRYVDSYELKGDELENAIRRHKARRAIMNKDLLQLRGSMFEGEKFIEDYREEGWSKYAF